MTHSFRRQAIPALAAIAILLLLIVVAAVLIVNAGATPTQPVSTAGVPGLPAGIPVGPIAKVAIWIEPPPPPPAITELFLGKRLKTPIGQSLHIWGRRRPNVSAGRNASKIDLQLHLVPSP